MMRSTIDAKRVNSRVKSHQKLFLLLVVIMIVLLVAPAQTFAVTYLKDGNYLYLKTSTTTCSIEEYLGTGER